MKTVLVTGARSPTALHLTRLLHSAGAKVVLADSLHFPLASASNHKSKYVRLPAPVAGFSTYAQAVAELVDHEKIDLVIPTCEEVFHLAAARDVKGYDIPLFAPALDVLRAAFHKGDFAHTAKGLGAEPPQSWTLRSALDITHSRIPYEQMELKPAYGHLGSKVLVKPTAEQLDTINPSDDAPWVVQEHLPGVVITAYAVARAGRLLAVQVYKPLYGASVAFEPVENASINEFVRRFVAVTGWTGQLSLEFRQGPSGELRAVECNPGTTSGVHFFGSNDNLVGAILHGELAVPTVRDRLALPLAMLAYGLPDSIAKSTVPNWWSDFQAMKDVTAWKDELTMLPAQLLAAGEFVAMAVSSGRSLAEASSADIAWDGRPFST